MGERSGEGQSTGASSSSNAGAAASHLKSQQLAQHLLCCLAAVQLPLPLSARPGRCKRPQLCCSSAGGGHVRASSPYIRRRGSSDVRPLTSRLQAETRGGGNGVSKAFTLHLQPVQHMRARGDSGARAELLRTPSCSCSIITHSGRHGHDPRGRTSAAAGARAHIGWWLQRRSEQA